MKHERQISQQIRILKSSATETSPYKFQVFSKNFKKKFQMFEPSSISSSNIPKTFLKQRKTESKAEIKTSPLKYGSKNRSERKRSFQKFTINTRPLQRTSLNIHPTTQTNLTTKSKMIKINNTLCQNIIGSNKEMMSQVYKRYDQYIKLTKEWTHLELFDQVDKLIFTLIQHYIAVIQDLTVQFSRDMTNQLLKYEHLIQQLSTQNTKMKEDLTVYEHFQEVFIPMRSSLMNQYQKCQWSTVILNSLSLKTFNLQEFVRAMPIYQNWIAPLLNQRNSLSVNPTEYQSEKLPENNQRKIVRQHTELHQPSKEIDLNKNLLNV